MGRLAGPSAVDLAEQWKEAQEAVGVPGAVAQLRTLKYRKVQGFEYDDAYREYMGLPLFRDITKKIIGDRVSVFRSMFFKCAKLRPSRLPAHSVL